MSIEKTPASAALTVAANKSRIAEDSLKDALDAAFDSGWELGILDERSRFMNILDGLERSLTNSEEDAKLTIAIIRKKVSIPEEGTHEQY